MTDFQPPGADDAWMTQYLHAFLLPRLAIPAEDLDVAVPRRGARSSLLVLRPPSGPARVARFHRDRAEAARLLRAHTLAALHELPAPRIVHHELSLRHRRRHGFAVLVEEFVEGAHATATDVSDERREALAATLAMFHAIERRFWGEPWRCGWRPFYAAMVHAKILNRIQSLREFEPEFTADDAERLIAFSRHMGRRWRGLPPFSLTHDKLNEGNVVFAPSGAYLIDLLTLRFGAPGKDLAAALYYFCSTPEQEADFKRRYFGRLPPRHREHFEEFEPLYRAWHHLSRWAAKGRAYGKRAQAGRGGPGAYSSRFDERDALWRWVERGGG
jgi:hypothetical protein